MAHPLIHKLAEDLASLPRGRKQQEVARVAKLVGLSRGTIYRHLRKARGSGHRQRRSTRVSDDVIRAIATVRRKCSDGSTKRVVSGRRAIRLAEKMGLIEAGAVSVGQYHRRARQIGTDRHRAVVRYEARASNDMHHVDASGTEYFKLIRRDDEVLIGINPRGRSWKNKRKDVGAGLWCYAVVDDHSRVRAMRYYISPGEKALHTMDFLAWAWDPRDPRKALAGVPRMLCADKGPFSRSHLAQRWLATAGVQFVPRAAYNPKAGGKVERPWSTQWTEFELPYLIDPKRVMKLDELNAEAMVYTIEQDREDHPRLLEMACASVYKRDLVGDIRVLPVDHLKAAFVDHWAAVRSDRTIQYQKRLWELPPDVEDDRVRVFRSADGRVAIQDSVGRVYTVEPFEPIEAGTYKMHPPKVGDAIDKAAEDLPPGPSLYDPNEAPATVAIPSPSRTVDLDTPFDHADEFTDVDDAMAALLRWSGMELSSFSDDQWSRIERLIVEQELDADYVRCVADELRAG
jgi:hypothetical protein